MTNAELVAYHGNPALKASVLAEMAEHRAADALVKGVYWENGRGCAVGCLTHDPVGGHAQYPVRWGIPEELAWLEDALFERLPNGLAQVWPERFLLAIPAGSDLSGVYAAWSAALMLDPERGNITRCVGFLDAEAAVRLVGALWQEANPSESDADSAADSANSAVDSAVEWASRSAVDSEMWRTSWSVARAARSAAWSAESARLAHPPVWSVARSAADSTNDAPAHWQWMADRLIACLTKAPVVVAS